VQNARVRIASHGSPGGVCYELRPRVLDDLGGVAALSVVPSARFQSGKIARYSFPADHGQRGVFAERRLPIFIDSGQR